MSWVFLKEMPRGRAMNGKSVGKNILPACSFPRSNCPLQASGGHMNFCTPMPPIHNLQALEVSRRHPGSLLTPSQGALYPPALPSLCNCLQATPLTAEISNTQGKMVSHYYYFISYAYIQNKLLFPSIYGGWVSKRSSPPPPRGG